MEVLRNSTSSTGINIATLILEKTNEFHFKDHEKKTTGKYTKTDKVKQSWENQIKNLNTGIEENKIYWDKFCEIKFASEKSKGSIPQYKSSIFQFIEFIDKDLVTATQEDINAFTATLTNQNTIGNKTSHIKSILTFVIKNNIAECHERVSKETLIMVISI